MPHCVLWRPSDWQFALTAIELAAYVHDGDTRLAGELRNWEKVLGTTFESRRDQRIRYVDPPEENAAPAGVTRIEDYREL
jgi:hypothetical protein